MSSARERILVAMSGGVDSSVVAARLHEAGHEVIGAFMRNGVASTAGRSHKQGCCGLDDAHDARRVADGLGIPFYAVDLEARFGALIDRFAAAYAAGRTPNPCVECNRDFKFGALLQLADDLGAVAVATGHYARIVQVSGRWSVARGRDAAKDQSYVLWPLTQQVLARTRLPLGDLTKDEVRAEARRFGLRVAEKPESMDICFVPGGDYRAVVKQRRPEAFESGEITDSTGRVVGRHAGVAGFTIGQRRGLPGGQERPLHVLEVDAAARRVVVGERWELAASQCELEEVNWIGQAPLGEAASLDAWIQIRAHHQAVACKVISLGGKLCVEFAEPVESVTPGQSAVVYDTAQQALLGGVIGAVRRAPRSAGLSV